MRKAGWGLLFGLISLFLILGIKNSSRAASGYPELVFEHAFMAGDFTAIQVEGNYAYVGNDNYFGVIEIADPEQPELVWYTFFPDLTYSQQIADIVVEDGYAYVGLGSKGLVIYSLADPAAPVEAAVFGEAQGLTAFANKLRMADDRLAVSGWHFNLLDVSVPEDPKLIVDLLIADHGVADAIVKGNLVYAATTGLYGGSIVIFDISNLAEPVELSKYCCDGGLGGGGFRSLEERNGILYAISSNSENYGDGLRLHILNVEDPTLIEVKSVFTLCEAYCYAHVFITQLDYPYLYITDQMSFSYNSFVEVFKVSNPASPVYLASVPTPKVNDLSIADGQLYLAGETIRHAELPLLSPNNIGELYGLTDAYEIAVELKTGAPLVVGGDEIRQLAAPASSQIVQSIDCGGPCNSFYQDGELAITLGLYEDYFSSESLAQLHDFTGFPDVVKAAEICLDGYDCGGHYWSEAYISGGRLGITYDIFFRLIDVTDPNHPVYYAEVNWTYFWSYELIIKGDYVFAPSVTGKFVVVDISDPNSPTTVALLELPGEVFQSVLLDDLLYAVSLSGWLMIIDVSIPENPVLVGTYLTPNTVYDIAVSGDYAFLADGSGWLYVIDVFDPEAPVEVASFHPAVRTHSLAVAHSQVLLLDQDKMLFTLRFGHSAYGRVTDMHGAPIPDVTLTDGSGKEAISSWAGNYSFDFIESAALQITPSFSEHVFYPESRTASLPPDASDLDFVLLGIPQTIIAEPDAESVLTYFDTQALTTTLTFSAGAVPVATQIDFTPTFVTGLSEFSTGYHAFELTGAPASGDGGLVFDVPAVLVIHYSELDIAGVFDPSRLDLWFWNGEFWQDAAETCPAPPHFNHDEENRVITTEICVGGTYSLMAPGYRLYNPAAFRGGN